MELSSKFSALSEARIRQLKLKPKNIHDVHILFQRKFYEYLNELLFQKNRITRKALQHLSADEIVQCKLYGLVFAVPNYDKVLSDKVFRDFLLEFVETSYPFRKCEITCDIDELLELSLTNNRLRDWLAVQYIRMPTLEDFRTYQSMYIPRSEKLRDIINRNLLSNGHHRYAIVNSSAELPELYIRFGILPDLSTPKSRSDLIVAYERTQNSIFAKQYTLILRSFIDYDDFAANHHCTKLMEDINFTHPSAKYSELLLHAVRQQLNEKFCLLLAKSIDWDIEQKDYEDFSETLIMNLKLPFAYTRKSEELTPEILVNTYLRNGFPVYSPFLLKKKWCNFPLVNDALWFKGYGYVADYCQWTPEHYCFATKWQSTIKTIMQISICSNNLLHILSKELLFEIIDALIIVDL